MNTSTLFVSQLDPSQAVIDEICPAGEPWAHLIKRGQTFRIV
ncbi:MAG: urea carboxylase, partial [Nitrosomonas sp.]